ncbi:MAG TPA: DinB family protein [Candidatus Limnocylindria bacterium]|nr:DinB family protein [Candidatus Limnocylindria bacterium]
MAADALVRELRGARADLLAALDAVSPESMTTPGLVGEWSGRELIAHLGYWAGHATEVIHAVEGGRVEEIGDGEPAVDDVNQTVARVARGTDLATVRRREAAAVDALIERLTSLDPALLSERLPDGATLDEAVREDGAAHYREHAEELRRVLEEAPRG